MLSILMLLADVVVESLDVNDGKGGWDDGKAGWDSAKDDGKAGW
jgi:hypothetical protein